MSDTPRFADTVKAQLREAVLDAAYDVIVAGTWREVRMADIAARVGVSRQTVYNEFGSRDGLAQALVLRQNDRFLAGIRVALDEHEGDLGTGIEAALRLVLTAAAEDPLTKAALTSSRGDPLLPFLTTRSEPLLRASTRMLVDYTIGHVPDLDVEVVESVADALVRLAVSHIVLPLAPADVTAHRLAALAGRALQLTP